jgi:tRNA (adenine22-N1)-methyltransferase
MTDRLNKIFSLLPSCEIFADIGCDHGYIAKAMLKSGKCKKAIISDISSKCLEKAEQLLSEEIKLGKAQSVVSNGFLKIDYCDLALIAGMGGQEIIDILTWADIQKKLPDKLVLQPMKNVQDVRKLVIEQGYKVLVDKIFKSGKIFYNILSLEKGYDYLTSEEIEFGRDNLKNPTEDFIQFIKSEIFKLKQILTKENLADEVKELIKGKIDSLEKYV